MYLAPHMWEKLRETGIENMSDYSGDESNSDDGEGDDDSDGSVDEMQVDDKKVHVEVMAAQMDRENAKQDEYAAKRDRNLASK